MPNPNLAGGCLSSHDNHYQHVQIGEGARAQLGNTYHIGRNDTLSLLPTATNACFNSYNRQHEPNCLPNTRVDLLQDIYKWADSQDERCIYWLNGLAGTGKSTIARTVARRYVDQKRLGASFFFSKGGGDVSHAGRFFTSIAVQLANNIPPVQQHIRNAVSQRTDIGSWCLSDQWRQLVLYPFSQLDCNDCKPSYIVIVDALDECEDENNVSVILRLLAQARSLTTVRLRVFLTSRPEIPIRYGMYQIPQAEHQDFVLHNILPTIVNHDISLFLEHHLGIIGQEWALGVGWPGEQVLAQLVQYASGLFIWAETACRFISKGRQFAAMRLGVILRGSSGSTLTAPEKHLHKIYATVLESSISSDYSDEEKGKLYGMLRYTLGSVIALLSPLSISSLGRLLHLSREVVNQTLKDLYAILDIPEDQTRPLRLHHPSFRDFLLSEDRCGNFWVDEKQAHHILATNCIQLMSEALKKDICEMHIPGSQASEVENGRVEKCLPPEVQYACLYWVQHLQRSGARLYDNSQIHQFLHVHLLHWLEALGWMGKTSEGILAILSLEALIPFNKSHNRHYFAHKAKRWLHRQIHTKADKIPSLQEFIHDAKRFALHNRSIIEQSPLQLYCSALVFAPKNSIVRRQYQDDIPHWIQTKPQVQANWNAALQALEGHRDWVTSVAFSPDGRLVVSGSDDRTVRLWDAATGAARQTLEDHRDWVTSVAFSPDGRLVVSGSYDKTVRLWDAATGAARQTLNGHSDMVSLVAFSPDGRLVVSGSKDRTVRLWDVATGAARQTLKGHSDIVSLVAFSPDGRLVVSGSDDRTVRLWDVATGAARQTLEDHRDWVTSVAFSPDGRLVVSGSYDKTVRLWDAATGAARQTLEGHSSKVTSVAFSPDGRLVVSGSDDKTVRLWDAATGAARQTLKGHSNMVSLVAFSFDGRLVVSGSKDRTVRLWDAATGAARQMLNGHSDMVSSVAFSPDGRLVVSGSKDRTVRLWDAATGAARQTPEGHSSKVTSVAFSPDGRLVVSGSDDKTVRLWDAATGAARQTLNGHSDIVSLVAFSPDGKLVVSGSDDKTVRLWNAATGAARQRLKGHRDWVTSVAFSPDGRLVVSGSYDKTVRLWDIATGAARQTLEGHRYWVTSVAFSPDGRLVVSGSDDKTVRLWDTATGAARQTLEGHSNMVSLVAFSPDGRLVVSGSKDRTVRLWDAATGAARQTLNGHWSKVVSVAFSPDGRLVVSGSDDRTVRLWDAATGAARQTLEGHSSKVTSVAFSPDGKLLPTLHVRNDWLVNGIANVLWLPADYLPICEAVRDENVVLGHSSGRISCLQIKKEPKLVIELV